MDCRPHRDGDRQRCVGARILASLEQPLQAVHPCCSLRRRRPAGTAWYLRCAALPGARVRCRSATTACGQLPEVLVVTAAVAVSTEARRPSRPAMPHDARARRAQPGPAGPPPTVAQAARLAPAKASRLEPALLRCPGHR